MLQQNPYGASAYRAIGIETGVAAADPLGLVVMLYDGAIQAIIRAESALASGAIEARGAYTSKAIDIITQGLSASLDLRVGGPLADSLSALYDYMGRRLFAANLSGNHAIFEEVRALLVDLRSSWSSLRAAKEADVRYADEASGRTNAAVPAGRSLAA